MLNRYPVSDALENSLKILFPDYSIAEGLLGNDLRDKDVDLEQRPLESPEARVLDLKIIIERYLIQMARELDEYGEDDALRLQSEAKGLLLALRELAVRFPEVFLREAKV